ncbi:4'-phosphopantetheinyl transferase superfamily protein [Arthrobacter sp. H5]|uniref:4'-phosphopantetheinyl transferase family protein n=1 Tax=Arthrobacter sp. H5 TaxID=1267973 RepID=UPI0004B66652|nr:4'-phosphopantetheinyl transferase superfamily protein [Arthrobacter sp. H5]
MNTTAEDVLPGGTLVRALRLSDVDLRLAGALEDDERTTAAKFRSSLQRGRFLAGRISLRLYAAELFGAAPAALRADYRCVVCGTGSGSVHGVPSYILPGQGQSLRVSLSRAGDWCLLAGNFQNDVIGLGVDVQDVAASEFEGFEAEALTLSERALMRTAAPRQRAALRTRFWVRKEAVLKALGTGLAVPPSTVDVTGSFPLFPDPTGEAQEWLISDVLLASTGIPEGFAGAVALRKSGPGICADQLASQDLHKGPVTESLQIRSPYRILSLR